MATVVNTPPQNSGNNGMGFLLGVIVLIVFGILFFMYIMPYITQSMQGPSVQVPDQVDVNVDTPQN